MIIYVGKAKNLRKRVQSYFRPNARLAPKVRSMVNTVADFEYMVVKNEAESLLTESSLIKKYKPHFNILMRDDKRYLALRADPNEAFPRFTTCRIVRDDGACYFGPFPSAPIVRTAKDFVEKYWGIRECNAVMPNEETCSHCMADVIRFCSAPCKGKITADDYKKRFEEACSFLRGEKPSVIDEVKKKMFEASEKGDFEKAAHLRDTVSALVEMTKSHFVRKSPSMKKSDAQEGIEELSKILNLPSPPQVIECFDISNLFGTHNVASMVVAMNGLPNRNYYRRFKIETFEGADDPRAMAEVVFRRYRQDGQLRSKSPKADLLVCDGGITQLRAVRATLSEMGINDIPTIGLAERMEEIILDNGLPSILLPRDSLALMVLTRLRDEAHRFAITYHRKLRDKTIRESVLDEVPGIGPAKKMKLLKAFGSVHAIAKTLEEDIAKVAGVDLFLAAEIKRVVTSITSR
ncbi:MAG: excinuclease ABC subunit UvrC [Kiritimatiellae bacterium]|nr:excinuclease ABC subunit UvrC [Kiritimatiellia bacterium]